MINLGDVRFGIVVETKSLTNAIQQINRFDERLQKLYAKQSSNAELAIKRRRKLLRAVSQQQNLSASVRRAGGPKYLSTQAEKAMARFAKVLTNQKASWLQVEEAALKYGLTLDGLKRQFRDWQAEQDKAERAARERVARRKDLLRGQTRVEEIQRLGERMGAPKRTIDSAQKAFEKFKETTKGLSRDSEQYQKALVDLDRRLAQVKGRINEVAEARRKAQEQEKIQIRSRKARFSIQEQIKDLTAAIERSEAPEVLKRRLEKAYEEFTKAARGKKPGTLPYEEAYQRLRRQIKRTSRELQDFQAQQRKISKVSREELFRQRDIARQETAVRRLRQQLLDLEAAFDRVGAPKKWIVDSARQFGEFSKQVKDGKLSIVEFARAHDSVVAEIRDARRKLQRFKAVGFIDEEADKRAAMRRKLVNTIRDLQSASVLAVGPLSGLGARIQALGSLSARSTLKVAALVSGVTALGLATYTLAQSMTQASSDMERYLMVMDAATGSTLDSMAVIGKTIRFADEYGVALDQIVTQYSKLMIAARKSGISFKQTDQIFESLVKTIAALRLAPDQAAGVFRAIVQMISKGVVSAEELRQQLGEFVPGAFSITAQAIGKTSEELNVLLKRGELMANDVVPKLAKELEKTFGKNAYRNISTLQGAQNRLNTAWFVFSARLDMAVRWSKLQIEALNGIADAILWVSRNLETLVPLVAALGAAGAALIAIKVAPYLWALGASALNAAKGVKALAAAMFLANRASKLNYKMLLGTIAIIAIAVGVYNKLRGIIEQNLDAWDAFEQKVRNLFDALVKGKDVTQELDDIISKLTEARNEASLTYERLQDLFEGQNLKPRVAIRIELEQSLKDLDLEGLKQLEERLDNFNDSIKYTRIYSGEYGRQLKKVTDRLVELYIRYQNIKKLGDIFEQYADGVYKYKQNLAELRDMLPYVKELAETEQQRVEIYRALNRAADQAYRSYLRSNQAAWRVADLIATQLGEAATAAKDLDQALQDMFDNIAQGLKKIAVEMLLEEPFRRMLAQALSFFPTPNYSGAQVVPTTAPAAPASPATLEDGPIMIGVAPDNSGARRAAQKFGGQEPEVLVQVIDQRGAGGSLPSVTTGTSDDGRRFIRIVVRDELSRVLAAGELDREMNQVYGLRRRPRR